MSEFIAVMVPPEMKEILRKWSEASGDRGISSIVRQLIEEGIARHYRQLPLVVDGDEPPPRNPNRTDEEKRRYAAGGGITCIP